MSVISARDLARTYQVDRVEVPALRGVTFDIESGEYVVVAGPSGSGKSTLLTLLGCLDRPTRGSVQVLGRDPLTMSDRELTRMRLEHIGFVFQRFHLIPVLTAGENVALPMLERGVTRRARQERVSQLLDYVGLGDRGRHRPAQLSGGKMQRVAIARALANRPQLLLADEPTGELDARTGSEIRDLFRRLQREGMTLIVVSHDERLASDASRVIRMLDGSIVA